VVTRKIIFVPTESDPVYAFICPDGNILRFRSAGEYDVPGNIALHLIRRRPDLFGEKNGDIKKARGVTSMRVPKLTAEEIVAKAEKYEEEKKTVTRKAKVTPKKSVRKDVKGK